MKSFLSFPAKIMIKKIIWKLTPNKKGKEKNVLIMMMAIKTDDKTFFVTV